jgi:hypothetical protein
MRLEESLKIKHILEIHYKRNKSFKYVINLGSGNIEQLEKAKPWVSKNVFAPLKKTRARILHVDAENFPGVDIVQDLSLPNSLAFLEDLNGSKLFILASVLEHIPRKAHREFLKKIYAKMSSSDGLIITVPNDYPYHADPIDNMYRPSPDDLKKLLPLKWLAAEIIITGSYREEFLNMGLLKKIRKLLKPLWIFQKPAKWLENHRLFYLFKKYQMTVVFGIR